MKSRVVNTKFWTDTYVTELDPSEKLVFIYLITNNLTNISGVYEITPRQISFDTGFELETIKRILGRFEKDKKIIFRDGWIAIKNFIKNQNQGSPQVLKGIERELKLAPQYHINFVIEGIDTLSHLTKPNLTKPNLTKLKEKDFIDKIIDVFAQKYFEYRDLEYVSTGKDRSAVGKLLKTYKSNNESADTDQTLKDFELFFDQCLRIQDRWYWDNMTLSIINSKLNEIRIKLRGENASGEEIRSAVDRNFG